MHQPGNNPVLVVSRAGKIKIPLSPFAPENLVSRDGFGGPVPHEPAHLAKCPSLREKNGLQLYMDLQNLTINEDRLAIATRSLKDRCVTIVSLTQVLV